MQLCQDSNSEQHQQIYTKLKTLVGPGAAAFHKDACFLMEMNPPLESTTHLVGHLLREIESSLRAILLPISKKNSVRLKGEAHKEEILAALMTLDIPTTEDSAQFWLNLVKNNNTAGLHKHAHREDLAPPRNIDDDFWKFWWGMSKFLYEILDRLETQSGLIRNKLDTLLGKNEPTPEDLTFLRLHVPNNRFALGYFFENLKPPEWLRPLNEAGFFNNPPGLEFSPEGRTDQAPIWAQSHYLIEVAGCESEMVLEISNRLLARNSNSILIYEYMAKAVLKMPPEIASDWSEKVTLWINQQSSLTDSLAITLGELIDVLSQNNYANTAISLAQEILAVFPQKDDFTHPRYITRIDKFYYGKIIKARMRILSDTMPNRALKLLCELLDKILSFSYSMPVDKIYEDGSLYWFQISGDDLEYPPEIRDILAAEIWNSTKKIVEKEPEQTALLLEIFQGYRWRFFDRMSLFLMMLYPNQLLGVIENRLTSQHRLAWLGLNEDGWFNHAHEHALLMRENFALLPVNTQQEILCLILAGPINPENIREERPVEYAKQWKRDWLSVVNNNLSEEIKLLYDELVQDLGEPISIELVTSTMRGTGRDASSISNLGVELAELAKNSMDELFAFLDQWQPSENSNVSRNEFAWVLAEEVIKPDPRKFVDHINRFKQLNPEFMICMLRGIKGSVTNQFGKLSSGVFSWEPVLNFCLWILNNLDINQASSNVDDYFDRNRSFDSIVDILRSGLHSSSVRRIPLSLRTLVWQVLESLTLELEITVRSTSASSCQGNHVGAYRDAINSVGGKTVEVVLSYALWIRQDTDGKVQSSQVFDDMPEVQRFLEWHLNPEKDPSFAIRAIYGKWVISLLHIASDWTRQQIDKIFPEDKVSKHLFDAAWGGYCFNELNTNVFDVLRGKYIYAISRLASITSSSPHEQSENFRDLPSHLLNLFWSSRINLNGSDSCLETFFAQSSILSCEVFMFQLGRKLLYGEFEVDGDLRQRLQYFIEWRISQAKTLINKDVKASDLQYFSLMFASGKLSDGWAIYKLLDVLNLLGTVKQCEGLLETLDRLAPEMPQIVTQCLALIADGPESTGWFASYRSENYRSILRAVLDSSDQVAYNSAEDLINRLLARSLGDYREILRHQ
jgi:hypothetical protein